MIKLQVFVENRWYRRSSATGFVEIKNDELPIQQQVNNWVTATGAVIVHPGQLGMHTTWHPEGDDQYAIKCVTIGLAVAYQEQA